MAAQQKHFTNQRLQTEEEKNNQKGKGPVAPLNSVNCREAWSFLYRMCKGGEAKGVSQDILEAWRAGGQARNSLLHSFVTKCYDKNADYSSNRLRLEAYVKLKQASKEWKKNMQGWEWLTEEEMASKHGWSEILVFELNSIQGFWEGCD